MEDKEKIKEIVNVIINYSYPKIDNFVNKYFIINSEGSKSLLEIFGYTLNDLYIDPITDNYIDSNSDKFDYQAKTIFKDLEKLLARLVNKYPDIFSLYGISALSEKIIYLNNYIIFEYAPGSYTV
jgi:hypothetical protein